MCSGGAALGYEIVWTRLCTPMLGSETLGILATLAGFFGGMAAGAALFHRRAVAATDPIALFVRLELIAAVFAIVAPHLLVAAAQVIPPWLGPAVGDGDGLALATAIAVAGALMLPGTVCLGATLAAAVEARRRVCDGDDGPGVGFIYAANTAGAVVGVLGTVYIVLPSLGLALGAIALAGLGVTAAVLAHRWGAAHPRIRQPRPPEAELVIDASRDPDPDAGEPLPLLVLLFGAGIAGVGLEVVGTLVLSQQFENTIYTFADVLAVYLAGTAAGAWLYARIGAKHAAGRPATAAAALLIALALATVLAAIATANAPEVLASLAPEQAVARRHIFAELAVAALVFAFPTILMGGLFSHVIGLVAPRGIGRAYAVNTLGGAIAPFVFGVWAPSALGYRDAFIAVAYAYLLVFGAFTWYRRFRPAYQLAAIGAVIAATTLGPKTLVLAGADPGWTTIAQHETPLGLVLVSEHAAGSDKQRQAAPERRLQIGRHFRMGGRAAFGERRMGQIPLVLRGHGRRALFLGIGTGATLGAVRSHPALETIDAVELVGAVVDELGQFEAINAGVRDDPRVRFHRADARRFVAASRDSYDVIVADLFHPGIDGAGSLYAREHFAAIDRRLAPDGLFAQWLPLHQLDGDTLRSIVCAYTDVFPQAHAWLGLYNVRLPALALVARASGADLAIDVATLSETLKAPVYAEALMKDPRDLLGARLVGPEGLARFCGGGPANSDLHPWVTLWAPKVAYEGLAHHGADNLARLLPQREPLPAGALAGAEDPAALAAEVAQFQTALVELLEGEMERDRAGWDAPIPAAAIDHYLAAFAAAPAFVPAHGQLLQIAMRSGEQAERILPAMLEAAPNRLDLWEAWRAHLRRIRDERRLAEVDAAMQARFGAQ